MTTRIKRPANVVPAPSTMAEADAFLRAIGEAQRQADIIQSALDETISAAKRRAETEAAACEAVIDRHTRGLQAWAEAHRAALTQDGATKTVRLPSGEVAWRARPPSIKLTKVEAVLATLLASRALRRFVRTKHEIDRTALLAEPKAAAKIAGVSIVTGVEDFVVTPTTVALAAGSIAA